MNGTTRDERLRRLLREADPAADDPGLSLDELREMRRTVLSAVPEPRRRWGLVPILAGAAMAILALVLGLMMMRSGSGSPTAPSRLPQSVATVPETSPAPVPGVPAQAEAPVDRATAERAATRNEETPRRRPVRRRPSDHRAPAPAPVVIAEAETHQIQFSTPGGTRIIWMLTSDKTSE